MGGLGRLETWGTTGCGQQAGSTHPKRMNSGGFFGLFLQCEISTRSETRNPGSFLWKRRRDVVVYQRRTM